MKFRSYDFKLIFIFAAFFLASCSVAPLNQGKPASVAEVVRKIKEDLDMYQIYDSQAAKIEPLSNVCNGAVSFYITSVKVSLTTQLDFTTTGTAIATLPVGAATIGPSILKSREIKGNQNTTFVLFPDYKIITNSSDKQPKQIDANLFPIAAGLQQLRDGLLEASSVKPCVSLNSPVGIDGKPIADDQGTFTFGFTVIKQDTMSGGIKLLLFSIGTSNSFQNQSANTITVTFKAKPRSSAYQ